MISFSIWGDSHMDDCPWSPALGGIGARKAFEYELHFNHAATLTENRARAGSQVSDWITDCLQNQPYPDVVVVSSGFNEAVAIELGMTTIEKVRDTWYTLIQAIKNANSRVLWVPTQYKYGRAADEFPMTEELHITPLCLGADLLEWDPDETDLCPDRVHHTYEASMKLCRMVLEKLEERK